MTSRIVGILMAVVLLIGACAVADGFSFEIAINEVAWGGNERSRTSEWIELVNTSDSVVDLAGWRLVSSDGSPDIWLRGIVSPINKNDREAGYFLLERESDDSVPEIAADLVYSGALTDRGEALYLYDSRGLLVGSANHPVPPSASPPAWPAGTGRFGIPPYASMERADPQEADRPENWHTWSPATGGEQSPYRTTGGGTPKRENSLYNLLPTAIARVVPTHPAPGEPALFDAGDSFDPNNAIVSYVWSFGDNAEATGQTASHTYDSSGEYAVSLIVTDEKGGASQPVEFRVSVSDSTPPLADFSVVSAESRRAFVAVEALIFRDESSKEDGLIVSWLWDFGDGETSEKSSPTHAYARSGTYHVLLVVTDEHGHCDEVGLPVTVANRPPAAQYTYGPFSPNEGRPVTFDASRSSDADGEIAAYLWDFDGDGKDDIASIEPIVTHAFSSGGTAQVILTVIDDEGSRSLGAASDVHVNASPVAQFRVSNFDPMESEEVAFSECVLDADGSVVEWNWAFGDGSTSTDLNPTHTYREDGTYAVTLGVVDDGGAAGTVTAEIRVANLPPAAVLAAPVCEQETGTPFLFDATASHDPSPAGKVVGYAWDFDGDGAFETETSSGTVSHPFVDQGTYEVRVRVTDDDGSHAVSDPVSVSVRNRHPRVTGIQWTPNAPTDVDAVSFVGDADDPDGEIAAWRWSFAGLSTAVGAVPVHSFERSGTHTVTLTVVDDDGAASDPLTVEILIGNAPPVAVLAASAVGDPSTRSIAFDATDSYDPSPTGRIVHVAWDFGDGTSCPEGPGDCSGTDRWTPVHSYPAAGSYTVTLVVIDDLGTIARATHTITVPG